MIQMDLSHIRQFIPLPYEEARAAQLRLAHSHLQHGDGAGGEFTGWVQLPRQYDREEFARIQAAAERIKRQSQVLVVVGIGGGKTMDTAKAVADITKLLAMLSDYYKQDKAGELKFE